jgi:Zn finger protein HypA/HybF involved in hydrogenase expression
MLMRCSNCQRIIEIDAHFQCATDNTPSTWELEMTTCPECGADLEIDDQPTVPLNPIPPGKNQRRPVTVSKTKQGVKLR